MMRVSGSRLIIPLSRMHCIHLGLPYLHLVLDGLARSANFVR